MLSAWLTVTTRPHRLTCSCAGLTRNVTGEAMPTSFVEALTQLSFLAFVQRCNLFIAPSQPTQLPAPVSLMDVAVQTASPCEVSQDSSTQTSDQPVSSLSLDVAVQTIFQCMFLIPGRCRADVLTQFSFPGRFYAVWFLPSFLVFS